MADPKNPGYKLHLAATADPDVVHVVEEDDVDGRAPLRAVSAVEAGNLQAAMERHPTARKPPAKKAAPEKAPVKAAPVKKAAKRG